MLGLEQIKGNPSGQRVLARGGPQQWKMPGLGGSGVAAGISQTVEMGGMRRLGKEQIYRIKLRTSLKPASLGRVVYLIVHVIHDATLGSAGRLPGVHKSMHEESGASER